jgi:MFS family permease
MGWAGRYEIIPSVHPRFVVLLLIFFLSIVTYLDRVAIGVAGGSIQKELNISAERWGWVLGVFTITYALFEIPAGALGDRIGPRRVLTRIVIWWSAFTAVTGAVTAYWQLLVSRMLFGAGEAGAFPNGTASIARWFTGRERARATSIMWAGTRVGGALTPLLVGPIVLSMGWRAAFFIFGLVGCVWAAAWFWYFRDNPADRNVGAVYLAELKAAGVEAHAHQPLPWGQALRSANFWYILLMYHLYCVGSFFYISWMPTYLEKGRGFAILSGAGSYAVAAPFLVGLCGNLVGGALSDWLNLRFGLKIARRSVGGIGLIISGILMLMTALTADNWTAVTFLALGYGAMDCMLPVSWAVCQDVGRTYSGSVSGAMNMAGQAGSFLSTVGFGYLVKEFGSYNAPLFPMAACLVASGLIFFLIDPTKQITREPATA